MQIKPILAIGALACLPALSSSGQADDLLAWKVEKQEFVRIEIDSLRGTRFPTAAWTGLWYELTPTGDRWRVNRRWWVPLAVALQLPNRRMRKGAIYPFKRTFQDLFRMQSVEFSGALKHGGEGSYRGLPCKVLHIAGRFTQGRGSRNAIQSHCVRDGGLRAKIYWHPGRAQILGGQLHSTMQLKLKPATLHAGQTREKSRTTVEVFQLAFKTALVARLEDPRARDLVNRAIPRGVAYLRKQQSRDGSWRLPDELTGVPYRAKHGMGATALVLLTLLKSGVRPSDPAVIRGFQYLTRQPLKWTYDVGLMLMAIEARYAPLGERLEAMSPRQRRAAMARIPGQVSRGDKLRIRQGLRFLCGKISAGLSTPSGGWATSWGYPQPARADSSNSQYGVLGLLAAERCGFKLPGSVWHGIASYWLDEQHNDGPVVELPGRAGPSGQSVSTQRAAARGWTYIASKRKLGSEAYGSMTFAGIGSLAIARHALRRAKAIEPRLASRIDAAIRDGMAWFHEHYDLRSNPGNHVKLGIKQRWWYYTLYGLERAGVLSGQAWIGEHHWYNEGAALLVSWQQHDGSWLSNSMNTCFALLFLKRSTLPLGERSGPG